MKTFTLHEVLDSLNLSYLKGSGFKMAFSLGNDLMKKGQIQQGFVFYWNAIRPLFLRNQSGWSENIWHGGDFLINHNYRCIYCPIGKVASTSLIRIFVQLSDIPAKEAILELSRGYIHAYAKHNLTLAAHHSQAEAMEILNDKNYFKFSIVRNPWTRIISAYLDKFVIKPHIRKSFFLPRNIKEVIEASYKSKGLEPDYKKSISFRQFVEYVSTTDDKYLDGHWKPQHLYLGDTEFDFIARFESLTKDFEYIKKKLNISKISLPHTNKSASINRVSYVDQRENIRNYADYLPNDLINMDKLPDYQAFYAPDLQAMIAQRYSKDIETFGYSLEDN